MGNSRFYSCGICTVEASPTRMKPLSSALTRKLQRGLHPVDAGFRRGLSVRDQTDLVPGRNDCAREFVSMPANLPRSTVPVGCVPLIASLKEAPPTHSLFPKVPNQPDSPASPRPWLPTTVRRAHVEFGWPRSFKSWWLVCLKKVQPISWVKSRGG